MPIPAPIPPDDANTYSTDFESTYSKTNSLKIKPTWAYVHDPETEIYLLSVAGPDNFVWVGRPQDFDWSMLEGKIVLAHNMGFDGLVLRRLEEEGVIPKVNYAELHCTADMAAYFKLPRALKDIAQFVFKMPDLAKKGREIRDRMKGMPVEKLMDDPEIRTYAANDAVLCRKLWMEWSEHWPEIERKVSRIAREGGWRGVKIDMAYVDDCVQRLHERMFDAAKSIPWEWDPKKTPLARKKMIEQAQQEVVEERELTDAEIEVVERLDAFDDEAATAALNELWFGKEPARVYPCRVSPGAKGRWKLTKYMWYPSSFAKDDEECAEWEDEYGDTYAWIGAIRKWRRHNMLLAKFQHLQKYTSADGRYRVQLKYFGAVTGRWSGAGFFNVQNLPRAELFCDKDSKGKDIKGTGFDLRRALVGPFYVSDYMQVEARALLAQVKDEATLEKIRAGMSVYEAHARATMGWDGGDLKEAGKTNPEHDRLYRLAKARCLAGDTLVLTDGGYKPISTISLDDMVWDGVEFVKHSGTALTGVREVVSVNGDRMTDDHEVFYEDGQTIQAGSILAESKAGAVARYRGQCSGRNEVRELARAILYVSARLGQASKSLLELRMRGLRDSTRGLIRKLAQREDNAVRAVREQSNQGSQGQARVGEVAR